MDKLSEEFLEFRKYKPEIDADYVTSTWLKCYRHFSYFAKRVRNSDFFNGHKKVLAHLFAKPINIIVACPKEDPDTILGYIAYEKKENELPVLHFLFIKETFRNMGVAKMLFEKASIEIPYFKFTHWIIPTADKFKSMYPQVLYDPYQL